MASLNDLTVVIPVFDRPKYLERQIQYWSSHGSSILIMDGSVTRASQNILNQLTPNMKYVHSNDGFNARLVESCKYIDTKYTVLLHDDEILAVDGLLSCIHELNENVQLIACQGRSLFFFYRDGKIIAHETYQKITDLSENYGDSLLRLKSSFRNGDPSNAPYVLYTVMRSDVWKRLIVLSYEYQYASGFVYELAMQIAGTYLGPIKVIDSLVWFRSGENPKQSSESLSRKVEMDQWITDNQFANENLRFIKSITDDLVLDGKHSRNEIEAVVLEVLCDFRDYFEGKSKRIISHWHNFLYFVNSLTPRILRRFLKRNMTPLMGKVLDYPGIPLMGALAEMEAKDVVFNREEMQNLEHFLLDFHKKLEWN
jgi:glycosyltransferase domain-containing protein